MRWLRLIFFVVGAIALTWLIVAIGPATLWDGLTRIGWGLAIGCGFHLAGLCLDSVALRALTTGDKPPLTLAIRASITGHAINEATPGGKLGELTKFTILELAVSRDRAAAALVAHNLIYFVVACLLIALAPPIVVLSTGGSGRVALGFAAVGVGFLIAAAAVLVVLNRGVGSWPFALLRRLGLARARLDRWQTQFEKVEAEWRAAAADRRSMAVAWTALLVSKLCDVAEAATYFLLAGGDAWIAGGFLSLAGSQAISWLLFFVPFQAGSGESGAYAVFRAAGLSSTAGVVVELARKLRRIVFIALGVVLLAVSGLRKHDARASSDG